MVYGVGECKHLLVTGRSTTLYIRCLCSVRQVAQLHDLPNQVNQPAGHITKIIRRALSIIINQVGPKRHIAYFETFIQLTLFRNSGVPDCECFDVSMSETKPSTSMLRDYIQSLGIQTSL
jgi:hypothetical protein